MADEAKPDPITGLSGIAGTIVKLGMAGSMLFMLMYKVLYLDPKNEASLRSAMDRNTDLMIQMQQRTHANQEVMIDEQKTAANLLQKSNAIRPKSIW